MKSFIFILVQFCLFSTLSFAQSPEEIQIRQLEKEWSELLDLGDTTALLKIWSAQYVVNNPQGKIVTPKKIVSLMKSGHKFPKVERIIENITFNNDIAIVMGKELQQPANKSTNLEKWIPRRFTNVWIKTEQGWQLAARQSSTVCSH